MEILLVEPIVNTPWYIPMFIVVAVVSIVIGLLAVNEQQNVVSIVCVIIAVTCIVLFIVLPSKVISENQHYVIEITDDSYYKTLIDKGYNLNKLYENRNIYELDAPTLDDELVLNK